MIKKFFYYLLILSLIPNILIAKSKYFEQGVNLFNKKEYEDARFKFEQDIVFNPKSELSYLYLSKIFNKQDNKVLEEQNLNTVMLLNPKNEEAVFYLAKLKLSASDFQKSKELNNKLRLICKNCAIKVTNLRLKLKIYLKNKCDFVKKKIQF